MTTETSLRPPVADRQVSENAATDGMRCEQPDTGNRDRPMRKSVGPRHSTGLTDS